MPKVAIVTDSTCDLPASLAAERNIIVTPLHIHWGSENLADGVDITSDTFYKRLPGATSLPTTSQPSPGEFVEKFKLAREKSGADEVVAVLLSKALSGTYSAAETAKSLVDFPVTVVDTRTASLALGYAVLAAADARDQGKSAQEIAQVADEVAKKSKIFFLVNTLEYLHRGGRIGGAQRLIGTALSIKPILHVKDGAVAALESVRTRKKSITRVLEIIRENSTKRPLKIGIMHSNPAELSEIQSEIETTLKPDQLIVTPATPVIGVHIGPEAVGIAVVSG